MNRGLTISLMTLAIACGAVACSRSDPRHLPIQSATPGAFARWRMGASDAIRIEEWREFDGMLQELRLRIMANREATGHEGIETALRSKVNGATFREVLVMGYRARLLRLSEEREEVRRVLNGNARIAVLFKDAQSEIARSQQEKRLLAIDDETRAAKRRLTEFGHY